MNMLAQPAQPESGVIISSNGHNYSSADTFTYFADTAVGKEYKDCFAAWADQHLKEDPSDWTTPFLRGYDLSNEEQRNAIKQTLSYRKDRYNNRLADFMLKFPVTGYITWKSEPYDD